MIQATREQWLNAAIALFRADFKAAGYTVPTNVRVSCGLPSSGAFGARVRSIGECWTSKASADQHFEIFISPTVAEPRKVLAALAHELVHATVGLKAGHKGLFIECARKLGFDTPWTQITASNLLTERLDRIAKQLGRYPHATLSNMTNLKKKQTTRLLKVVCYGCLYTARITATWLVVGVPNCPNPDCTKHGKPMEVEMPKEG